MGKLHDQMRDDLILKAYSPHTLVRERQASPATQDMYVNALKFLYTITLKRSEVVKTSPIPNGLKPSRSFSARKRCSESLRPSARLSTKPSLPPPMRPDSGSQRYAPSRSQISTARGCAFISARERVKKIATSCWERASWPCCAYYQAVRPQGEYLFPGQKPHSHISTKAVSLVLRKVIRETGLSKKVTMHTLRLCFATHLMEAGTDIHILQVLLGHSSIRTTLRYTHITDRLIQKLVSPLDMIHPAS